MSTPRLLIVFVIALALSMIAFAPLSLGLAGKGGLTAREVEGTVWSGRLTDAALGPLSLGAVKAGLDPLRLLTGKARFSLKATGGQAVGRGRVTFGGGGLAVDDLTGSAPLSALGAPPPFDGVLRLKAFDAVFAKGRCMKAAGELAADLTGLGSSPIALTGKPICQGPALALPLSGGGVSVLLIVQPDGRYRSETKIITEDAATGAALTGAGFTRDADGYGRTTEGRLQ